MGHSVRYEVSVIRGRSFIFVCDFKDGMAEALVNVVAHGIAAQKVVG